MCVTNCQRENRNIEEDGERMSEMWMIAEKQDVLLVLCMLPDVTQIMKQDLIHLT